MFALGRAEVDMSVVLGEHGIQQAPKVAAQNNFVKVNPVKMSLRQQALHDRALAISLEYKRVEFQLIEVLQDIEREKIYKYLECASVFKYAVDILGLPESVAYAFITVARKAKQVAALHKTLFEQSLTVHKISRMVSVLNDKNADELIQFAQTHSSRELDAEVARLNPKAGSVGRVRVISENRATVNVTISKETLAKLKRAQAVSGLDLAETLDAALDVFLQKKDPLKKLARKPVTQTFGRSKITAAQKHLVNHRDQRRCTYIDARGKRCENERFLHIHHLKPVSEGGSNHPDNLKTLCGPHHDLVHQMNFELRSPVVLYTASG